MISKFDFYELKFEIFSSSQILFSRENEKISGSAKIKTIIQCKILDQIG